MTLCGWMVHVSFKAPGRHLVFLRFTPLRKHYSAFKGKKLKPSLHRDLTCSKALGDSAATRYSTQTRLGGFFLCHCTCHVSKPAHIYCLLQDLGHRQQRAPLLPFGWLGRAFSLLLLLLRGEITACSSPAVSWHPQRLLHVLPWQENGFQKPLVVLLLCQKREDASAGGLRCSLRRAERGAGRSTPKLACEELTWVSPQSHVPDSSHCGFTLLFFISLPIIWRPLGNYREL